MQNLITPNDRIAMLSKIGVKGKICAEIGVYDGWFSNEILNHNPAKLYMIDPWVHQGKNVYPDDPSNMPDNAFNDQFNMVLEAYGQKENVEIVRDFSFFAAEHFANKSLDFVYIDAIHTFESVLCDMVTWYPKVADGGWLCGHDFTGRYIGVKAAVESFCRITGKELSLLTLEQWASWGIKK